MMEKLKLNTMAISKAFYKQYNLTINKNVSKFSTSCTNLLDYTISDHAIPPDQSRLQPLLEFCVPEYLASLVRVMKMFPINQSGFLISPKK